MDNELNSPVLACELAKSLGLQVVGADLMFDRIEALDDVSRGALCFSKKPVLNAAPGIVFITPEIKDSGESVALISSNPRLDFARALNWLKQEVGFKTPQSEADIHPSVQMGNACAIGPGVRIGAGTLVGNNVTIGAGAIIGERCVIKSGAVIGEDGFGFERDESGLPVRLVHLGGVMIGNDVEIGSLTTVCRGTLRDTVIEDSAKIDDHVHIAHNVIVRRGAMVIACAEVSGGVEVGEFSWVGPNASIIQQLKIGSGSLIGIAANVLKNVPDGAVMVGNPAKQLSKPDT